MDRRSFIKSTVGAMFGFMVLPPATTYERIWRATRKPIIPYWYQTNRVFSYYSGEYIALMDRLTADRFQKAWIQYAIDTLHH